MSADLNDMRRVTEALMRTGHYDTPEDPNTVEWMVVDAERVLAGPLTYEGLDEALIDVGLHDPEDCNILCVSNVLEALS